MNEQSSGQPDAGMIVTCSACGATVIARRDGLCPSCQSRISDQITSTHDAGQVAAPECTRDPTEWRVEIEGAHLLQGRKGKIFARLYTLREPVETPVLVCALQIKDRQKT
ncbi:MAG TPA: hypothetical protein EYG03_06525 [Planctomycetes bacterium]|nr:hypothetical protein [Fuerstiella sp.]HIK91622.1 hypothetical protein [Planctomycetota bacterium]